MKQIYVAQQIYLNNHHPHPLVSPADLFPEYISDPLVFWHPGDPDPPPTTINNDVPNAPNSACISFDLTSPEDILFTDDVLVRDNSSQNNGGLFVNYYNGTFETEPPLATPIPTRIALAKAHLRSLGWSMALYTNDNQERFPTDLLLLWQTSYGSPRSFWNPGDSDAVPQDITNSIPNNPNSVQVSFDYLASGLRAWEVTPETVLLRDNDPANNEGFGALEIVGDNRLRFALVHELDDVDGDCFVGPVDWAALAECFAGLEIEVDTPRCYAFEADEDHIVSLLDASIFQNRYTGLLVLLPECFP